MKGYNSISDAMVVGDFSVPIDRKDTVAKLYKAIPDALVMLESRVIRKNLLGRFQKHLH
jgi:hypothetical protein